MRDLEEREYKRFGERERMRDLEERENDRFGGVDR